LSKIKIQRSHGGVYGQIITACNHDLVTPNDQFFTLFATHTIIINMTYNLLLNDYVLFFTTGKK